MVERHMTAEMNLDGNNWTATIKMDRFFSEYVCGTRLALLPDERILRHGDVGMSMKMTQSNVIDNFPMRVPVDLELPSGMSSWEEPALQATAGSMRRFLCRA
jgi:hypothetical protein